MATVVTEPPLTGTSAPNACATIPARIPAFQVESDTATLGSGATTFGGGSLPGRPPTPTDITGRGISLSGGSFTTTTWRDDPRGGISYCRVAISGSGPGPLSVTVSRPGKSVTVQFPAGTFTPRVGFTAHAPLPGVGGEWVTEADVLTIEVASSGSVDIYDVRVEGVYPLGSAYATDWAAGTRAESRAPTHTPSPPVLGRSDTLASPASTEDFPVLWSAGSDGTVGGNFYTRKITGGGGSWTNRESYNPRLWLWQTTHLLDVETGQPDYGSCPYPDAWEYQTSLSSDGTAASMDYWSPTTGYITYSTPEYRAFQASDHPDWHPNASVENVAIQVSNLGPFSEWGEPYVSDDTPHPAIHLRPATLSDIDVASAWTFDVEAADSLFTPTGGGLSNSSPTPIAGSITPTEMVITPAPGDPAEAYNQSAYGAVLELDPDWVTSVGRPIPGEPVGIDGWEVGVVPYASSLALTWTVNDPPSRLLYLADGWDWDYPGGIVSSGIAYKVRKLDGTWYTLGSGSQAKIRALDGSWYVENVSGAQAKVRLAAGSMGPGVDFGKE